MKHNKVLIIYTGGTIGMVQDDNGALHPFALERIIDAVPQLGRASYDIDSWQLSCLIDSSNMNPGVWVEIAEAIEREYDNYDGFVVLHGTDTMAYTASALSFMFEHLAKPIVLTGSQLPLGMLRSDGRENMICALEIASTHLFTIPEVCIFFESRLYRGNRSTKVSAEEFNAFDSFNYPSLAQAGISINCRSELVLPRHTLPLQVHKKFCTDVAILKLYPGITESVVRAILDLPNLRGVVLETYGSGNAPTEPWFINAVRDATSRGVIVVDVTQCKSGAVEMCRYEASCDISQAGVIGGRDITIEAAITKLMFLLGQYPNDKNTVEKLFTQSLRGEITN